MQSYPPKSFIDSFTQTLPFSSVVSMVTWLSPTVLHSDLQGVTQQTADPPGGVIVCDPKTGEPTGILKDAAQNFVWKVISAIKL